MNQIEDGKLDHDGPLTAEHLHALAEKWAIALTRLHAAEQAAAFDKEHRSRNGVVTQAVDAISDTPAEVALATARDAAKEARDCAVPLVQRWLDQHIMELLESDRSAPPWSVRQALHHLRVKLLLPRLREWRALAADAIAVMEAGAARCRPAGSGEFLDQIRRWPSPSLVSLGISSLAAECVANAVEAASRLQSALPTEGLSVDLEGLNDIVRRLIEYLRQPTSLAQDIAGINKHDQVAEKLEMMARMLTPLTVHLAQLIDRAANELAENAGQMDSFLDGYKISARRELPKTLQILLDQFENKDSIKLAVSVDTD